MRKNRDCYLLAVVCYFSFRSQLINDSHALRKIAHDSQYIWKEIQKNILIETMILIFISIKSH